MLNYCGNLKTPHNLIAEAVTVGSYHSIIWNKDFPRLQILSIEELLNGAEVKLPPSSSGALKKFREKLIGGIYHA